MPDRDQKRLYRELALGQDPEAARETGFDYGKDSTRGLNGLDQDRTRRRQGD